MSEQDNTTQDGAADETSVDNAKQDTATESKEVTQGQESLGDAGKKALDTMKAERNQAKSDLATLRSEFEAFKAKAEGKEAEHAAAIESQRVKDEALSVANLKIAKANLRAAAAGKLADPKDALTFIDASKFEVDDDGNTDDAVLSAAIDDLIKTKPYLAAQGKRFEGGADGGARKDANTPSQLTRSDMDRMTPEQISEAMKEGRFANLLAGK